MTKLSKIYNVSAKSYDDRRAELKLIADAINEELGTNFTPSILDYATHSYKAAVRVRMTMGIPHVYIISINGRFIPGDRSTIIPDDHITVTLRVPDNFGTYLDQWSPSYKEVVDAVVVQEGMSSDDYEQELRAMQMELTNKRFNEWRRFMMEL